MATMSSRVDGAEPSRRIANEPEAALSAADASLKRRSLPGRRMLSGRHWVWYLAVQLIATGLYFLLPRVAQAVVFLVVGFLVAPAILIGTGVNRPYPRRPWYLLAAGALVSMGVANVVSYLWPVAFHKPLPFPSAADGLYLSGYGVLLTGLAAIVRTQRGRGDRAWKIDTTIITLGLAALSWVFLISPNLQASGLALPAKITSVSYPLVDVMFLAVLVRLALLPRSRIPAYWFLFVAVIGQLSADTAYGLAVLNGSFDYGQPMFAGWLLSYGFLGAAALHPSMRVLSEPAEENDAGVTKARVAFLAGAALLTPALIALQDAIGHETDDFTHFTLAIVSAMVFVLVIARLRILTVDISDLRRAQACLRESEGTLRAIFEASPDMITLVSTDGRLGPPSPAVRDLLGYEPDDYVQMDRMSLIHPDDQEQVNESLQSLLGGGPPREISFRVQHAEGHWVMLESHTRAMTGTDGRQGGLVAVSRNVTEKVALEDALRSSKEEADVAREEAERANGAKSEFLSRMSHELRTPLNAILGFGQLLEMEGLEPPQQESVHQILKGGRHLLDLINEVLDIARIESGRITLSLEPVLLVDVLQEGLRLIRPLADERGIELEAEDVCPADRYVLADRQRLKQVFLNLLSNAVKYNRPNGRVTVRCMKRPEESLRVEIGDQGAGIAPPLMDKLFVPFERLAADDTGVEGSGLGLALSKGLMEAMGGRLGVGSTSSRGSTFYIELPETPAPNVTHGTSETMVGRAKW